MINSRRSSHQVYFEKNNRIMAVKQDDLSKENIQKQPPEVVCKKIFAKFTLAQVTKDTLTKNTLAQQNTSG